MSTRGSVARLTNKPGKEIKFAGVYLHWDNYPSATGATLFKLRNGFFKGDTEKMLKLLIDEHPAGWSTINDADFNIEHGYIENRPSTLNEKAYEEYKRKPQCFCHGDRKGKAWKITQNNASKAGCEYVYAFSPDGKTMIVLSSYRKNGNKMIGAFGMGDSNATWKVIGEIDLDGNEPANEQWEKVPIEQGKNKS